MTALSDYRLLGKSGVRVSPLCLGAMTFGEDWGWGADEEVSRLQFDMYRDQGGNFIDTANAYTNGTSEKFVGKFIKENRDYWVLATKFTLSMFPRDPNAGGNHRKNIMRSLEDSLRRLQTDYVDLYWLHGWEFRTRPQEVMRALDDLVRQGKVLYIGVSNTPAWVISKCNIMAELQGWTEFAALQMQYSLVERTSERDMIPMCADMGLGTTPWSPLGFGLLSGKFSTKDLNTKESTPRLEMIKGTGLFTEKNLRIAEEVSRIAKEIGRTSAQVALNWVSNRPGITSPILGARTAEQLADNLASLEFTLDDVHMERLNEISDFPVGYPHDITSGAGPNIDGECSVSPEGFRVLY